MYLLQQVNMMLGTLSWRRASPPLLIPSSSVGNRPPSSPVQIPMFPPITHTLEHRLRVPHHPSHP
ncbi:uncharacterized protein LY79DRAFT_552615 [Colletotrichum navitas]|uniref:Uncharacterized protein n=1 Tax=Colletotrichum navitas TaxID=681940 RepID=A0AAD8Q068_9PEZI|nr:uncharacterized protein LY79DRAFT_552615 [Colletotrichum navitas]KAK1593363.1 hypothetical protein LY79DRAFT_552615 [Colletotrichum navitas]